jgi:hypothetical protein
MPMSGEASHSSDWVTLRGASLAGRLLVQGALSFASAATSGVRQPAELEAEAGREAAAG